MLYALLNNSDIGWPPVILPGIFSAHKDSKQTVSVGLGLVQSCLGSSDDLLIHSAILSNYIRL